MEGIEVAWNVVKLSRIPPGERKRIKTEVKLLKDIEHKNIIKYHNSWVDRERQQIVFITEIMSSGSLKEYDISIFIINICVYLFVCLIMGILC